MTTGRGMFTGLCYLCGAYCGRTYCPEHTWAADALRYPDRVCSRHGSPEQIDALAQALTTAERVIAQQEKKLDAWRARAALQPAA